MLEYGAKNDEYFMSSILYLCGNVYPYVNIYEYMPMWLCVINSYVYTYVYMYTYLVHFSHKQVHICTTYVSESFISTYTHTNSR